MTAPRNTPAEKKAAKEYQMAADEYEHEPRPPWNASRRQYEEEAVGSVADPGYFSWILIFVHPRSRILVLGSLIQKQQQKKALNAETGFSNLKHESIPLSVQRKYRRLCRKAGRIDW